MRGGRDAKNVEHNSAIFSPAMLIFWLLTYNAVHANLNLWVMHVHCALVQCVACTICTGW